MTGRTGWTSGSFPVASAPEIERSRTSPGVALWSPPRQHDPLRVVSRARERDRRVRAADDRSRARVDALRPGEAAQLAALRGRGGPPVRRPAHRDVRLAPRADAARRLVPALLADAAGRSGHL